MSQSTGSTQTSIIIPEAESGKRIAFRKSHQLDEYNSEIRYAELVSIAGERFSTPLDWDCQIREGAPMITSVDGADISALTGDILLNTLNLTEEKTLYAIVEHSESNGTCGITPLIFDAGENRGNSREYVVGSIVHYGTPQDQGAEIGECFECTTAGISAAECPAANYWWSPDIGETVEDGTVIWTKRRPGYFWGQLEKKTSTASALRWGNSSGNYLSPVLSWDVCGAWFIALHITELSTSNGVKIFFWAL